MFAIFLFLVCLAVALYLFKLAVNAISKSCKDTKNRILASGLCENQDDDKFVRIVQDGN